MVLPLEESRPLLDEYDAEFTRVYQEKMRAKLGLLGGAEDGDAELFKVRVCVCNCGWGCGGRVGNGGRGRNSFRREYEPTVSPPTHTHTPQDLFSAMEATGADFTMTFVGLMALTPEAEDWRAEEVGGWVGGDMCIYVYVYKCVCAWIGSPGAANVLCDHPL